MRRTDAVLAFLAQLIYNGLRWESMKICLSCSQRVQVEV